MSIHIKQLHKICTKYKIHINIICLPPLTLMLIFIFNNIYGVKGGGSAVFLSAYMIQSECSCTKVTGYLTLTSSIKAILKIVG